MDYRSVFSKIYGELSNSITVDSTTGDPSILLDAIASNSTAIALIVYGFVFALGAYYYLLKTNISGQAFGSTWEATRWPLMAIISLAMILPPPGDNKENSPYSASHLLYIKALVMVGDVAQVTWDKYRPQLNNNALVSNVTTNSVNASVSALSMLVCAEYWNHKAGVTKVERTLGGFKFGEGRCGQVLYPSSTNDNLKYAKGSKESIDQLFLDLNPLAVKIVKLVGDNKQVNVLTLSTKGSHSGKYSYIFDFKTVDEMRTAVADFRSASARFDKNIKATVAKEIPTSDTYNSFLMSGAISYDLAKRQRRIYDLAKSIFDSVSYIPPAELPDQYMSGEIRTTDLTNLVFRIASHVIREDQNSGVESINYTPWTAIWNGGDPCISCFQHTQVHISVTLY